MIDINLNCDTTKYLLKDKLIFLLYALYFIISPFYLWSSGLPQLADLIMLSLLLLYLSLNNFSFPIQNKSIVITFMIFVVYSLFVNLLWSVVLPSNNVIILPSIYNIYNFLIFVLVNSMVVTYGKKIYQLTFYASFISILLQLFMFIVGGGFSGARAIGSFNNPNQLGYYSLLIVSILIFISSKLQIKAKWLLIGILSGLILVFASLSKAAILGYLGVVITYMLSRHHNKIFKRKVLLSSIVILLGAVIIYNTTDIMSDSNLLTSVQTRIEGIGSDDDDNLEGRGYDRIINHPEFWLFGAGEGEYDRFKVFMEFHSTLGNIQVSYGIIGLSIFICLLMRILKKDGYNSWFIIFFILLYGLTHNGIRNSIFWILLSLIGMTFNDSVKKASKKDLQ